MQDKLAHHEIDLHQQWVIRLEKVDSSDYLVVEQLPFQKSTPKDKDKGQIPLDDLHNEVEDICDKHKPISRTAYLQVLRDVEHRRMKEICLSMLGQGLAYSNISKKRQPDMSQDFIEYLDGEDRLDELKTHLSKGYADLLTKVKKTDRAPQASLT